MKRMSFTSKKVFVRGRCIILIMMMIFAIALNSSCTKEGSSTQTGTGAAKSETASKSAGATTAKASGATSAASATASAAASTATSRSEETKIDSQTETSGEQRSTGGQQTDTEGSRTDEQSGDILEEKVIDLGGRVIDVDLNYQVRVPTQDNPVPYRALQWRVSKEIEEKYNCKINYMVEHANNSTLTINSIREKALSGTEDIEVRYVSFQWVAPSMVESGYFIRLDDYIPKDSFAYEHLVKDWTEWKGHGYGFCPLGKVSFGPVALTYNKDILNRLGIDIWEQYVYKGIWTWENFVEVARAATQDTNGDGIIDQWGLKGWSEQDIAYALIASNNGNVITTESDGSVKYTLFNDQKAVQALQFMSDLYNVYKVTFVGGTTKNIMQNGFGAMSFMNVGGFSVSKYTDLQSAKKMFTAPVPRGPQADKHIGRFMNYVDTMVMPNIPGNPNEEIVQVMADLYAESYRRLGMGSGDTFDIVAINSQICQSWFMNNLDTIPEFLELVKIAADPIIQNLALFDPIRTQLNSQVFTQIARDAVPVTSKLMETKNVMQAYIDAAFGN